MKMAGNRKWIILAAVIASLAICAAAFYFMLVFYIPWKWREGTFISYSQINISANHKYVGVINEDDQRVEIRTHSGKEVSYLVISEDFPNQIALGEDFYFLLYRGGENGKDRIARYNYQSEKMNECTVPDIATIACQGGFLFLGNWRHDEDGEWDGLYFDSLSHGFYANSYYAEEKFGGQPQTLDLRREGRCLVGDVELHNHYQKYFSTEPVLEDYPGSSGDDFDREDKLDGYMAETRQEEKNRALLVKAIGGVEGVPMPVYSVQEYQKGNLIYGVCNVMEEKIPHRPTESEDVARAYFYRINPAQNQCDILAWKDSCLAIIGTDSETVYQKGREILRQDLSSGKEEVICQIKNSHDSEIEVKGDFLLVKESERHFLPRDFSSDKRKYIPVKWRESR